MLEASDRDELKIEDLTGADLADFIACYNPENRHKRKETWHAEKNPEGRWRKFTHAELLDHLHPRSHPAIVGQGSSCPERSRRAPVRDD